MQPILRPHAFQALLEKYAKLPPALFAASLSLSLLIGAWIFEYGFGYAPCQMCYWQRHIHKIIIGLSLLALLAHYRAFARGAGLLTALTALALLASAALAGYHMGVEYQWWEGPKSCSGGAQNFSITAIDPDDPLSILDTPIKAPSCGAAVWHFLGLSMAAWNAILSFLGAIILFGLIKYQRLMKSGAE